MSADDISLFDSPTTPPVTLRSGRATVDVSPIDGGRVSQITVSATELLVGPVDDDGAMRGPMLWGSYPMVPFAGRLRNATFSLDGRRYDLEPNMAPHAIHGCGFDHPWTVVDAGLDFAELALRLRWPLGGRAHQHIQLDPDGLTCVLSVTAGDRPMPAVIGWHPWFVKPSAIDLAFEGWYRRDADWVATAPAVPAPPMTAPDAPAWDDCFVGAVRPPTMRIGRWNVRIDSDCDHWVIYDMPHHATCVEPQTGPPDAFNMAHDGREMAQRLEPGEMLQRSMRISWTNAAN